MSSEALDRFARSMTIGYDEWHDGIGYDLLALDEMTEPEKRLAAGLLIPRAAQDWRDLEALDRLATAEAIAAIVRVRQHRDPQIRLRAHEYGPEPTEAEWETAIVASLDSAELYGGLTQALDCAVSHPSEAVEEKLWDKVRDPESGVAYHCAAALCCIHGVIDSMVDDSRRKLFLRIGQPESGDRTQAIQELETLLQ
jgi:hypothetical protein